MKICVDCQIEKEIIDFVKDRNVCKRCYYLRYKDKPRPTIKVICPTCATERDMRIDSWKKRKTDLCGKCHPLLNAQLFKSQHGLPLKHPLYIRWTGMKRRCRDVNKRTSYLDKGITVCDDWLDYGKFYEWSINNGFDNTLELDRIDASKGYSPDNCQWITHKENMRKIENLFGQNKK